MQNFFLKLISAVSLKALILFLVSCELFAYENVSSMLSEQAKAFVENNIQVDESANIKVTASSIDGRIKIPPCDEMFEFNASSSSLKQSNVSVKITCPSTAWYLFTNVKVAQTKPIVVAAGTLSPGDLLTKANIKLVDTDINKLRSSSFSFIEDIQGARLKRRVRPGQIISPSMLCFVCKGDRITISANTSGLSLKAFGIAQQDGNLGDTIRVKNTGSKKVVSATVASTNEVSVMF